MYKELLEADLFCLAWMALAYLLVKLARKLKKRLLAIKLKTRRKAKCQSVRTEQLTTQMHSTN